MKGMKITKDELHRSAMLAYAAYHVPAFPAWTAVKDSAGYPVRTISVVLDRNLIGEAGRIKIILYIKKETAFLAYSGTDDLEFWLYSFNTRTTKFHGMEVHSGFYDIANTIYTDIQEEAHPDGKLSTILEKRNVTKIIQCGHSAGGAVAGLMGLMMGKKQKNYVVDFGTPRYVSGEPDFPNFPYDRYRFQQVYDLIPCIPLTWRGPLPGYNHFGKSFYFLKDGSYIKKLPWYRPLRMAWDYAYGLATVSSLDRLKDNHEMISYTEAIFKMISGT